MSAVTKQFRFHSDAGHGWLAVKRKLIEELGIAHRVSSFSYQSSTGKTVYLEEDCDATLFASAYCEKNGLDKASFFKSQVKYSWNSPDRSFVRSLHHYAI